MFGKLVKYEFRATARILSLLYLVTIFLALVNVITCRFNLGVASDLSFGISIFVSIAQISVSFALLIWRYYKNMYANEGYLTHTLPVKPSLLLWSKLLVAFVWSVISYIVTCAAILMVSISMIIRDGGKISDMGDIYHMGVVNMGMENYQVQMWLWMIALLTLSIILVLMQAYFSITVGNLTKLHSLGIGGPILIFVLMYLALQVISAISTLFIPIGIEISPTDQGFDAFRLVFKGTMSTLTDQMSSTYDASSAPMVIGIAYYILLPFLAATLLYVTSRLITKRTSIR
jgi:hypothetical protein